MGLGVGMGVGLGVGLGVGVGLGSPTRLYSGRAQAGWARLCRPPLGATAVACPGLTPATLFRQETVLLSCRRPGHPSTHKTFNFER